MTQPKYNENMAESLVILSNSLWKYEAYDKYDMWLSVSVANINLSIWSPWLM